MFLSEGEYDKSIPWYQKAALKGHPNAYSHLAYIFEAGRGRPVDLVEAYMWYSLASERGSDFAYHKMAVLDLTLSQNQIDSALKNAKVWKAKHGDRQLP